MTRVLCWLFLIYMGYRRVWVPCTRREADRRGKMIAVFMRRRSGNEDTWPEPVLEWHVASGDGYFGAPNDTKVYPAAYTRGGYEDDCRPARRVWAHKDHIKAARSGQFSFRFQDRLTRT